VSHHPPPATLSLVALQGVWQDRRAVLPESSHASDHRLLQCVARGDTAALAELYDRHSRLVFSVILRILRSRSDAEDVLQEVFVRVWTRADSYDERLGVPAAWLTRIARNRSIDRLRAKRARGETLPPLGDPGEHAEAPQAVTHETPELLAREAATASGIRVALAELPAAQRALIEAAFFDGYTHQELAARFTLPLGTVKTRIRSGLSAMRERLEHFV
jgi:RNA polymerase sigma-70 factor (ECF subfamily)